MRVWSNGKASGFQPDDVGSIPTSRSGTVVWSRAGVQGTRPYRKRAATPQCGMGLRMVSTARKALHGSAQHPGSNPGNSTQDLWRNRHTRLVQNQFVAGSNPARSTFGY